MTGWTTVTIETGSIENRKQLAQRIENTYNENHNTDVVRVSEGFTVKCVFFGYDDDTSLQMLRENQHLWNTACVMNCNDTTDSGSGTVYESSGYANGFMSRIDYATGNELQRGHDAKKELSHHLNTPILMR